MNTALEACDGEPDERATHGTLREASALQMKATSITWGRTFPDSEPGTVGVALFESTQVNSHDLPPSPPPFPLGWIEAQKPRQAFRKAIRTPGERVSPPMVPAGTRAASCVDHAS